MDTRTLVLDDDLMLEELGRVRRVAQRLLGDPNDADDVVQEAWLRTRTARVRFESRGRLRAWLVAVAHRMARDTLRARRRRAAREQRAAQIEARADAADVVERSALLERLLQAVRTLDEPQRSTVLLRYLDGHSTAEIAAAMSVSEVVVRKRLARTRAHLRAALGLEDEVVQGPRGRSARVASCVAFLFLALVFAIRGPAPAPAKAGAAVKEPELAENSPIERPSPRPTTEAVPEASAPELAEKPEPVEKNEATEPTTVKLAEASPDGAAERPMILSVGE